MKSFTKKELIYLGVIFLILIAISVPNFIDSLRRARDQVRRDDMGGLEQGLDEYLADFHALPLSTSNGRIIDCLKPGDKPVINKDGRSIANLVPCDWGVNSFANLITGKVYIPTLPRDPDYKNGVTYLYFSDGNRWQIYASMEARGEAEIDPKIIARNLECGTRICNIGRSYAVPTNISIEKYDQQQGHE